MAICAKEPKMQRQTKFEPLQAHLKFAGIDRIRMTFDEFEQVIGSNLPASARQHRGWWSNNQQNGVIAYAWLEADYKAEGVSIEHEFLTFRNDASLEHPLRSGSGCGAAKAHPVLGCMSGKVTISTGANITKPSLPEWKDMLAQ